MAVNSKKCCVGQKKNLKKQRKKEKKKNEFNHQKYTYKENRRRVLTMSFKKLLQIDNPESLLNKAVLINNMLRKIRNQIVCEASICPALGQEHQQ